MMRWVKKENGKMIEWNGGSWGKEYMLKKGWLEYNGALPLRLLDIVDNVVVELPEPEPVLPDTTRLDNAYSSFRAVCEGIGTLIGSAEFKGGFDEMAVFQASPQAATSQGMLLALQWVGADKLCTYEAARLGIGQPEWWYQCWGIEMTQQS